MVRPLRRLKAPKPLHMANSGSLITLPASPTLQDLPLYFQAVTFQFGFTVLDRISNPNAIRLGNANSFRDRAVYSQFDRAFATVIQRPDRKPLLVGGARGQLLAQQAHPGPPVASVSPRRTHCSGFRFVCLSLGPVALPRAGVLVV